MNPHSNLSISVLFTVTLSTGFLSVAYIQRAHAFSIDFSELLRFGGDQGLNFFQRLKGEMGDTGLQGPAGQNSRDGAQGPADEKDDKGDTGAALPQGGYSG